MNYGGDAADQIVRYSMEGMEHTLRISGSIAKNLAVLIVAVMKDQKKTRGKTNLLRMLKEQRKGYGTGHCYRRSKGNSTVCGKRSNGVVAVFKAELDLVTRVRHSF